MEFAIPTWLSTGMGIFALLAAAVLLVQVTALRRVAAGAVFAEHMVYVTGGILLLSASVLVGRVVGLVDLGIDPAEARLFADALVGVSMVLLGVYLVRVRRAMQRYLAVLSGEAAVARAHVGDVVPDGISAPAGAAPGDGPVTAPGDGETTAGGDRTDG